MKSIKILSHNVLGYNLEKAENDITGRPDVQLAIYKNVLPDIICLQEMTAEFRASAESGNLRNWLKENYTEISYPTTGTALENDGGTPTPVFVRKDAGLTLVESGYIRAREQATKGTTWAVLKTETGTVICVSNSHFVSRSEIGTWSDWNNKHGMTNAEWMRYLRVDDTNVWLNKLTELENKYPGMQVIACGDFNTGKIYESGNLSTPWQLFAAHGFADVCTGCKRDSIDYLLCKGEKLLASGYTAIPGTPDEWGSDHAPHYVCFELYK